MATNATAALTGALSNATSKAQTATSAKNSAAEQLFQNQVSESSLEYGNQIILQQQEIQEQAAAQSTAKMAATTLTNPH